MADRREGTSKVRLLFKMQVLGEVLNRREMEMKCRHFFDEGPFETQILDFVGGCIRI